ncbi:13225_t:CDS:1, partial [Ambispora leptoticha]
IKYLSVMDLYHFLTKKSRQELTGTNTKPNLMQANLSGFCYCQESGCSEKIPLEITSA